MDEKQRGSNKIRDIVRLQQLLKKWKKLALTPSPSKTTQNQNNNNKSINFLKKTLSFSDITSSVPKGYFSVSVGEEMKRYVVPTDCLTHVAFVDLLREAEEEFGFQQEGVLRIPCDVAVFESVLRVVMNKKDGCSASPSLVYCSAQADASATQSHHRRYKSSCR